MKLKTKSSNRSAASTPERSRVARSKADPARQPASRRQFGNVRLDTILVPVDFSAGSLQAMNFSVSLARHFGASIVLLHVLDPIYLRGHFDSQRLQPFRTEALAEAKKKLAALAKRRVQPNVPVTHSVRPGVAYCAIVEAAASAEADLIVMGGGRSGMKRFLSGSVSEKVIRHAPCPVLVMRDKPDNISTRRL